MITESTWPPELSIIPKDIGGVTIELSSLVTSLQGLTNEIDIIKCLQKIMSVLTLDPNKVETLDKTEALKILQSYTTFPATSQHSQHVRKFASDIISIISPPTKPELLFSFFSKEEVQFYERELMFQRNQLMFAGQVPMYAGMNDQYLMTPDIQAQLEGKGKKGKGKRRGLIPDATATFVVTPANSNSKIVLPPSEQPSTTADVGILDSPYTLYGEIPQRIPQDFKLVSTNPANSHIFERKGSVTKDQSHVMFIPSVTINKGIWFCECMFYTWGQKRVGIIDNSSDTFDEFPGQSSKSIGYAGSGFIEHNGRTQGNEIFEHQQRIGMQVNMDSNPRTLHFFLNGRQQPVYCVNIPPSIRFCSYMYRNESMVDMWLLDTLSAPIAKPKPDDIPIDWNRPTPA
ncbi:hypothetical protein BLNAU_15471 [Blattamonas nauphoetae]|uniref:SPRY domain-containing protein n=1 Tax=Blattamonas nauphoetae TaxID=2049346 RepID=A0ABQ9XAQ2_9EUKA|nr:hypothetical protein BLNAU_15471 [Blattamonas nauphoetae]